MNLKPLLAALFVVTAAASAPAHAAPEGRGDLYYAGLEATDTMPGMALTRAEVRDAAIAAYMSGLIARGEVSVASPSFDRMPKTRAQVRAETLEAIRLNAISRGNLNTEPTPAQLESIRAAGLRALAVEMEMASR